jgi:hypothetical protein
MKKKSQLAHEHSKMKAIQNCNLVKGKIEEITELRHFFFLKKSLMHH